MKKICYALAALAAMAAVSCQEKSNTENVPGTLTATFANPASKVTYTETEGNALQPAWEVDDEIIGFDDAGSTYTFTVIEVKSTTATLIADKPVADGTYHLIYKSGAQSTNIQEKSLIVSYADQAGNETMPAVMLADGEVSGGSCNFEFDNAGAIIGISALKGVPASSGISKITVTGENLSEGKVELNSGALVLTATTKDGDAISTATLSGITVTDTDGTLSTPVFVAVPAGAKIAKVSSATVGTTDTYSYTLSAAKTCNANNYLYVKTQEFKKDVTGTATRTGNIDVNWVQLWEGGPKFAEYNVGAANNKAEDYGGYYCWGGSYENGEGISWTSDQNTGDEPLSGNDDTATKLWGENWRMPTKAELQGLIDNCTVENVVDPNDVAKILGRKFTGKTDPYKSNSVFLPAAGYLQSGTANMQSTRGYYRSSTPYSNAQAYSLIFTSAALMNQYIFRDLGISVRAVLAK